MTVVIPTLDGVAINTERLPSQTYVSDRLFLPLIRMTFQPAPIHLLLAE